MLLIFYLLINFLVFSSTIFSITSDKTLFSYFFFTILIGALPFLKPGRETVGIISVILY